MADKDVVRQTGESVPYKEIYFLGVASQSNIYCCSKLQDPRHGYEKLLVGTLRGKVSCLECRADTHTVEHQPQANEVYFTYIPGDAEIISLDAFCKFSDASSDKKVDKYLVVGISLILIKEINGTQQNQHFLNVYTAVEPDLKLELDDTAKICQHIQLNFTPYQLTHTNIHDSGEEETVFLLAGSDRRVHMFRENRLQRRVEEYPCDDIFPEFKDLPSNVIWMDIKEFISENKRITAFGCQNGYVRVAVIDIASSVYFQDVGETFSACCDLSLPEKMKNKLLQPWAPYRYCCAVLRALLKAFDMRTDSPVSSVKLFPLKKPQPQLASSFLEQDQRFLEDQDSSTENINLLVTSTMELAVVFLEVTTRGFSRMATLSQSDSFGILTCSSVMDFDCDGNNEILLGTYGQELLIYKWYRPNGNINDMVHFDLKWRRSFPKPLFAIENLDLVNDGLQELAIVSLTGVHILQYDVDLAADIIIKKLQKAILSDKSANVATSDEKSSEDDSEDVKEDGDPV